MMFFNQGASTKKFAAQHKLEFQVYLYKTRPQENAKLVNDGQVSQCNVTCPPAQQPSFTSQTSPEYISNTQGPHPVPMDKVTTKQ